VYLATKIIKQAGAGLQHMHQAGWLHCDVKPDNYLINESGEVKLTDFNIAQRQRRGVMSLFGGKKIQGTRSYMSPEQIRGERLDARADLYSLGCMIFEMIAGEPPYRSGNADDLLNKHLKATVPLLVNVNENITKDFCGLIARTMAKDRQERPESMDQFLRQFDKMNIFLSRVLRPQTAFGQADANDTPSENR